MFPKGGSHLGDRKRLVWVFFFTFSLFCLLILQFFKIQIIEGDKWTKVAEGQHQLVVTEPFKRGLFYSNTAIKSGHPEKPQPFVVDVPKFHLYIDPKTIPESMRDQISQKLCSLLRLQDKDKEKLRVQFNKKSRSRKLVMWVSREDKELIDQWWNGFAKSNKIVRNAVFFVQDYKRSYPFGKLLGQVLHTVREERDANSIDSIPTGGLEMSFNKYLKGKEGKRIILRTPRSAIEDEKTLISAPEDGADVYLTINHYLQAIAEEEIAKAVQKANAKSGWAVMMDPFTGEILLLAQYPSFDPSSYQQYFNDPNLKENTKVKALTDAYEPGSTFKPITLAVSLQANIELQKRGKKPFFHPNDKIETTIGHFPGRSTPLKDTSTHHYLNMYMAMQKSSNVYMAKLVQRIIENLGVDWYRNTLQNIFGFGLRTGIELPSESPGLLPTPGKKHPSGALEWSGSTPYSLAMGHNVMVNSFQMLKAYGVFANGGFLVTPTLVRKIVKTERDGSEKVLLDNTSPERVKNWVRVLDKEVIKEVITCMKYVTKPGGTAFRGDIYGYTEVGKTGTTEKIVGGVYSKSHYFSTFIGFAPAVNPRFVLLVAIDEPEAKYIPGIGKNHHGGYCAAPAFREIAQRSLQYLGVEPDDPFGYPPGDPRYDGTKADWVGKAKELLEHYRSWNGK